MNRWWFGAWSLLLVLGISSHADIVAQEAQSPFGNQNVIEFQPIDKDKIAFARRLIAAKKYQEAADLLEIQYESDPDNDLVQNLLRSCYDQLQQYAKAEILIRRIIEKNPRSIGHLLSLAELLVKLDNRSDALGVYNDVARLVRTGDPGRFLVLVKSLLQSGLDDRALVRIEEARQSFADADLFAIERGGILEKRREYRQAAEEYLPLLEQDTTSQANRAEKKLMALLQFEESSEPVEELLVSTADSTSGVRIMRLLSDHFLKAGRFEDAFAYVLRQDSLEGATGFPLVGFMRRCQERRRWTQAARMAETILEQYPGSGFEVEVSFEYARALAELDRAVEAIEVYSRLMERSPDQQTQTDALYGCGVIYLDYLNDCSRALVYFDSVINHYPRGRSYLYARKAAPLCHLREGRLEEARVRFGQLRSANFPGELLEEAAFFLGLIDFFDHRYDSAETALRRLMVDFPQGFYVNDALQLVLAMREAKDMPSALNDYSTAYYLLYRGMGDSARVGLYVIADRQPPVLGDLALYQLIELELERLDSAAALEAINRLARNHPESYYRPLGLKVKADLLAGSSESREEARELYRLLLEDYSEYPFIREIREKLRRLDDLQPVG